MDQTTEAACLLQSGSLYSRRIGFRTESGQDIFAGIKPGAVSIYFGDAPIYHFDLDGRWQRAFVEGVHYLKGLDVSVQSIDREREGVAMVLRRNTLAFGRTVDLDDSIRSVALGMIGDLDSGRLEIVPGPPNARTFEVEEFREFLGRVSRWDPAAWFSQREKYLSTYGPMPFLPPDCLNSLVLQASIGDRGIHAFGRKRPSEYHLRTLEEFEDHAKNVSSLVGRRISQSRGIFLGGADVLTRPVDEIVGLLETIGDIFPEASAATQDLEAWDAHPTRSRNVHAFLDDFSQDLPDSTGWSKICSAQLGHAHLGVESGDSETLSLFGKSWNSNELRNLIVNLKMAGIGIGLVVLIGSGGRRLAAAHLAETATLLSSLPLELGDLVSLVDVRNLEVTSNSEIEPLSDEETASQVATLKERVASSRTSKGPKLVAYNPDKQWS